MKSVKTSLPKNKKLPIPNNCQDPEKLPRPVQDLADLLAEITAKRLMTKVEAAPREPEKNA